MLRGAFLLAVVLPAAFGGAASSAWSASVSGTAHAGAATMVNAAGFTAACTDPGIRQSDVELTWTASPSVFVNGYEIRRSDLADPILIAGREIVRHIDKPPISKEATFSYTIRATSPAWSVPALPALKTISWTNNRCSAV